MSLLKRSCTLTHHHATASVRVSNNDATPRLVLLLCGICRFVVYLFCSEYTYMRVCVP